MTPSGGTPRASNRTTGAPPREPRAGRRAFTLLEMILVVMLLALFATVTAPRITGTQSRRAEVEAEAVRSLLSTAAHRDATSTEPMALVYDAATARLSVEVRRPLPPATGQGDQPAWRTDPLISPVTLTLTELRDASTELQPLGKRSFRIAFPKGEPRPAIRLVIAGRAGGGATDHVWAIDLPSAAPAALMSREGSTAPALALPPPIDLDAVGRGEQPW